MPSVRKPNISFEYFLDSPTVMAAVNEKNRKVLLRTGGIYRSIVRLSMRKGKRTKNQIKKLRKKGQPIRRKSSKPRRPPLRHTNLLRDGIFFNYDPTRRSVFVGAIPRGPNAADVLEYGGRSEIFGRQIRIAARPFVGPESINYPKGEEKLNEFMSSIPFK